MANKEKEEVKKKSTLVHDTICLFMITLISGLLLGAGYTITKKPIAAQEEKNKQEAYEAVYQGASFEEDSALNKSLEAKVDGKDAGYVVSCSGKGYGGAVSIALGIDEKGEIKGIQITDCSNETPGLGQKSSDKEFNGQFIGTNASQDLNVVKDGSGSTKDGTINAITSATITSKAVTRAIDGAFQFISSLE